MAKRTKRRKPAPRRLVTRRAGSPRPEKKSIARLTRDLEEARQQQTATAEVLKVAKGSTFDLQTVLDTLVESAARLCRADKANIARLKDDRFHYVAFCGFPPDYTEYMKALRMAVDRGSISGRAVLERGTVHIPDVLTDPEFTFLGAQKRGSFRTALGVPLMREGAPIGVLFLTRVAVDPFTRQQIDLVETFADQAVIAIENVRLFDEVQARTRELSEALEQQTATADMLNMISRSSFDLPTVLDTLVELAVRICHASNGNIARVNGDRLQFVAFSGFQADYRDYMKSLRLQVDRGSISGRAVLEGRIVHIHDVLADPEFTMFAAQKHGGFRTGVGVPLMHEGTPIGVFFLTRPTVDPFTPKQIALLATFADQAVIAIENARLFEAEQRRTRELAETLDQQTATSEVLRVISSSPGELEPVFEAMLANATRICEAKFGILWLCEGDGFRCVSLHNAPAAFADQYRSQPVVHPVPGTGLRHVADTRQVAHITDMTTIRPYIERDPFVVASVELGGYRTVVNVPMLKENNLAGAISIYRQEVQPFTEKQIELVKGFANQAVIAIENTRLLYELRETVQQQTATADVLKVISRSTFDLQAVLNTLVDSGGTLCEAENVQIFLRDGEVYQLAAHNGFSPEYQEFVRQHPIVPGRGTLVARTVLEVATVHIPDALADPEYTWHEGRRLGNYRAMLGVPLLRDGSCVGVMAMTRTAPRPFTPRQIELVTTFADQAVIAIENVRLFDEVQARTRELTEALEQQTATSEVLQVISRSPGDLEPVFQAMLANATRLCGASYGAMWLSEGNVLRNAAFHGEMSEDFKAQWRVAVIPLSADVPVTRVALSRKLTHVADIREDRAYLAGHPLAVGSAGIAGMRTLVVVPMLKEDEFIGAFAIYRKEVRPFTDKQIELVTNFAAQAVIAIENTRLLSELRELLQRQTATTDVLKVISRSTFDLQAVLDALVEFGMQPVRCVRRGVAAARRRRARFRRASWADPGRLREIAADAGMDGRPQRLGLRAGPRPRPLCRGG